MKKRRFFRISKRVFILILCCTLVSGACFDKYKIEAHAAAISAEVGAEAMMLLWNLMINSMVATGAGELVANYDDEKLTFEAFMDKLSYEVLNAPNPNECGYVMLEDGTKVGLKDVLDGVEDGSIDIPDIGDWGGLRDRSEDDYDDPEDEILKRWDEIDSAWKEKHGGSLPDPSEGPQFSKIQEFLISIGVIEVLQETVTDLYDGLIAGLEDFELFESNKAAEDGFYHPEGWFRITTRNSSLEISNYSTFFIEDGIFASTYSYDPLVGVLEQTSLGDGRYGYNLRVYCYIEGSSFLTQGKINYKYQCIYPDGTISNSSLLQSNSIALYAGYPSEVFYSFNFPVFATYAQAKNYALTGDDSLNINKSLLSPDVLITATPEIMAPMVGKQLSPAVLQSTYTGMKSAYQTQIKPQIETETNTETNTKTYQETMTETILETVPETSTGTGTGTETKPDTGITPGTGTGSGTGTGTGTGTESDEDIDIEKYKVNLNQVFPFCIPFDFIALLRVLDAEPEAPRFEIPFVVPSVGIDETYVIDLSMFDDVMEVIRLFELVGFVIGLMFLTGKVIKW